jgi:hypothetical protein
MNFGWYSGSSIGVRMPTIVGIAGVVAAFALLCWLWKKEKESHETIKCTIYNQRPAALVGDGLSES